jgi:hypothetical protein
VRSRAPKTTTASSPLAAASTWPDFEVNPNDGGDLNHGTPVVARPRILCGSDHPSALLLPVPHGLARADVALPE